MSKDLEYLGEKSGFCLVSDIFFIRMGKAEFGTPKWISNNIKSKGLQKLRWYCQMCQKQCRDENGFKCHTSSEAHQRQLLLFSDNSGKFLDSFSREFESNFMNLLKRCHGTKRTFANQVYQEYIKDKEHVHMNATKWVTLSGFIQYLGKSGKCTVDETEKGWYITWIDRDPETIARQEAMSKKDKLAKDDDERMADFIRKQVDRERERKGGEMEKSTFTELKRNEDEKITLGLKMPSSSAAVTTSSNAVSKNVFKSSKGDHSKEYKDDSKKRKASALEEIMKEEKASAEKKAKESKINKKSEEEPWLRKNIMVKIVSKSLGEKYYKQKGYVKEVVDDYCGVIVTNAGAKIKLDQNDLETVIPAIGRKVVVLKGKYKGEEAILKQLNVESFCADIEFVDDGYKKTLPYECFSKKYES